MTALLGELEEDPAKSLSSQISGMFGHFSLTRPRWNEGSSEIKVGFYSHSEASGCESLAR